MIRKATEKDIPAAMELFTAAKSIMRSDGNMTQWEGNYPNEEIVRSDISKGGAHIVDHDRKPVGYFALLPSPEPTYSSINGKWLDDTAPYFVIHRIASSPKATAFSGRSLNMPSQSPAICGLTPTGTTGSCGMS